MCSSSMTVCILIFLQISHVLIAGQFAIIPPKKPIVGFLGKEVLLPCQLTSRVPESTNIQVQWILDKSSEKIDVNSYYGQNRPETQDNRYRGRAELSRTDLNKGNMSLILKKTHLSDQGNYTCMIFLGEWYNEVVVELLLAAKGTEPTIALVDYKGWKIGLTCSSNGWYPKPKAFWLDSEGKVQSKQSDTTITETKAGNFSVSSSVTTESGIDHEVSCKIINELLGMESESRILISDALYPATSPWLAPFLIILLIFICLLVGAGYKVRQNYQKLSQYEKQKNEAQADRNHVTEAIETEKRTGQTSVCELERRVGQISNELEVRRAQQYAVAVTLDSYYKHPEISRSEDKKRASLQTLLPGKGVTAMGTQIFVGKEGYAAGKHYWEVEVGERVDWELGVLTQAERNSEKKFRKKKVAKSFQEGCWALKSSQGKLFSSPCEKEIEKIQDVSYSVIGLLLDQEKWEISFYNCRGAFFLMDSIPIKSRDKLYPFLDCGNASENSGPKSLKKSNASENSGPKPSEKSNASENSGPKPSENSNASENSGPKPSENSNASENSGPKPSEKSNASENSGPKPSEKSNASENSGPKPSEKSNASENSGPKPSEKSNASENSGPKPAEKSNASENSGPKPAEKSNASENSGPKPSEKSNASENSGPKPSEKSISNL
ncbi:butyrophilin subfamily 3 member A2-like [Podarcis lilfordi]|uniref:Butyrophilin subfamily 3 member A2-like n=1 Tax=Podarcis lilfordi TaxID=74358 RepID=A0AA35L771_9SAUR|nr:butyrophilin subfamily 3 member A2-like [Podarcis lilfordi]